MNRLPLVVTSKLRRCLPALLLNTHTRSMSRVASVLTQTSKFEWTQRFNLSSETTSERASMIPELEVKIVHGCDRTYEAEDLFKAGFFQWNETLLQALFAPYKVDKTKTFELYLRHLFRTSPHRPFFVYQGDKVIGICATSPMRVETSVPDGTFDLADPSWNEDFDFDFFFNTTYISKRRFPFQSIRARKHAALSRIFDGNLANVLRPSESMHVLKIDFVAVFEESMRKSVEQELIKAALKFAQESKIDYKWIVAYSTTKKQYRHLVDELGFQWLCEYPAVLYEYVAPTTSIERHLERALRVVGLPVEKKV